MAYAVLAYMVMVYIVMAYAVMTLYSHGLCGHDPYSFRVRVCLGLEV